jgi:hypothetical protein
MFNTNIELIELVAEFNAIRQSKSKRPFPIEIWLKAISLSQKIPLSDLCRAIGISIQYFRKKIAKLSSPIDTQPLQFLEVISTKHQFSDFIKVSIESARGHKVLIEGISASHLNSLVSELIK